jgi:hypothetical protein
MPVGHFSVGIRILGALCLCLLGALPAAAQANSGEISGVVRDSSGAVLPGTSVVATHAATNTVVERVTDAQGRFFLPALQIGLWDLRASLPGFTPQIHRGVALEIGRTLTVDFTLSVEGLSEQVVVETVVPLLQSRTA